MVVVEGGGVGRKEGGRDATRPGPGARGEGDGGRRRGRGAREGGGHVGSGAGWYAGRVGRREAGAHSHSRGAEGAAHSAGPLRSQPVGPPILCLPPRLPYICSPLLPTLPHPSCPACMHAPRPAPRQLVVDNCQPPASTPHSTTITAPSPSATSRTPCCNATATGPRDRAPTPTHRRCGPWPGCCDNTLGGN